MNPAATHAVRSPQGMVGQPTFVLVRPQLGENIGAVARAMLNFGLERLSLVNPRDGWPNPAAGAAASGAGRLLDAAVLSPTVAEALTSFHHVVATTARRRVLVKRVHNDPAVVINNVRQRIAAGQRVALLFGPERSGLENDEIALAGELIEIPTNPAFPSLNLAQSALLLAWEWHKSQEGLPVRCAPQTTPMPATAGERACLVDHYEAALETAGFFFPANKAPTMKRNLRNLFAGLPLSGADVRLLQGVLKQLVRGRQMRPFRRAGNG